MSNSIAFYLSGSVCGVELCDIINCLNGGTCHKGTCLCPPGFSGTRCETNIEECASDPCPPGGTCEDRVNGYFCNMDVCHNVICQNGGTCDNNGQCQCHIGYSGTSCENQICANITCYNGGTCDHDHCACAEGFTGSSCEENIDECLSHPCVQGATCVDGVDGYQCIQEACSTITCQHGGTCLTTSNNTAICQCEPGFVGKFT